MCCPVRGPANYNTGPANYNTTQDKKLKLLGVVETVGKRGQTVPVLLISDMTRQEERKWENPKGTCPCFLAVVVIVWNRPGGQTA